MNAFLGKDCPVDFDRVLAHIRAKCPYRQEESLDADKIRRGTKAFIATKSLSECSDEFIEELR